MILGIKSGKGQQSWYQVSAFHHGEWLRYKVKWGVIRLGTIEIYQEKLDLKTASLFRISMHARSVNLPFINVFFTNEGVLNPAEPTLKSFTLISGKDGNNVTTYTYNTVTKTVLMTTKENHQIIRMDSMKYAKNIYDAVGIFMMIRCLSNSGFNVTLNNIVEFKITQTHLNFIGEREIIKVSAFDTEQKTVKFSGRADWVGNAWAGITGPFRGWILDDSSAIPLKVQLKIFLGSITLELEDFKRLSDAESNHQASFTKKN
ncbi:MAG: DUF3108 domain-containing protein [bacterium]|nr:MAG: DUF3108 domain-containing protein [bacterium]